MVVIKVIFIFFTVLYSVYTFFDIKIFHNLQGSKLNIKKRNFN